MKKLRLSLFSWFLFGLLGLATLLFFGFTTNTSYAATPPSIIVYEGKLLSGSASATTTLSMKFLLYDAATAGNVLYTAAGTAGAPTAISVTPSSGIFSVGLGDSGTNALDPATFRDNGTLYLEVQVGGETLSPRKQVTAAPFAYNALYLNGVGTSANVSSSAYIPVADSQGNFAFTNVTTTFLRTSGFLATASSSVAAGLQVAGAFNASSTFQAGGVAVFGSTLQTSGLATFTTGFISNASSSIGGSLQVAGALNASSTFFSSGDAYITTSTITTANVTSLRVVSCIGCLSTTATASLFALGINTSTPIARLTINEGALVAVGTFGGAGATPIDGAGTRLMWIPNKAAFRAGYINGSQWDAASIGIYSAAFGENNTVAADRSFGAGTGNTISAAATGAVAFGGSNSISVTYSGAFGLSNTVNGGGGGFALGMSNTVSGASSAIALGTTNVSSGGTGSTAIGSSNTAGGTAAIALGSSITVNGNRSLGIGLDTTTRTVSQNNAMAIMGGNVGIGTVAPGYTVSVTGTLAISSTSTFFATSTFTNPNGISGVDIFSTSNTTTFRSRVTNAAGATAFLFNTNTTITSSTATNDPDRSLAIFANNGVNKFAVASGGSVYAAQGFTSYSTSFGIGDLAENVNITPGSTVEAGDVVVVDALGSKQFHTSNGRYASGVAGVISNSAQFVMGAAGEGRAALGLAGLVQTKVTAENGPIASGDYLVTASKPGYAMRYNPDDGERGSLIGVALESFTGEEGKITVLLSKGMTGSAGGSGNLKLAETATGGLVQSQDTDWQGHTLFNVASIKGSGNFWSIDETGNLKAKTLSADKVTTKELVVEKGLSEKTTIGEAMVKRGEQMMSVANEKITPSSKIFITFRGNPHAFWWISKQEQGSFELSMSVPTDEDVVFDYWLVGVDDAAQKSEDATPLNITVPSNNEASQETGENTAETTTSTVSDMSAQSPSAASGALPEEVVVTSTTP